MKLSTKNQKRVLFQFSCLAIVVLLSALSSTSALAQDPECTTYGNGQTCVKSQNCKLGTCNDNDECDAAGGVAATDADCLAIYGVTCANLPYTANGGACDAPAAVCGNGIVEVGEQCDDGNTANGDCCSSTCQYESAGSSCGDGSSTECTSPDTCDGSGVCLVNHQPDGTACGDQGVDCYEDDACGSGLCVDAGFSVAGTSCGDGSSTECTSPDTCDGSGVCLDNHVDAGESCSDTNTSDCLDAQCDGTGLCDQDYAYEAVDTPCGDLTPEDPDCDAADSCNDSGVCLDNNVDAGESCSDTNTSDCLDAQCDGTGLCDQDFGFESEGYACGDQSDTECTDPDTCDDSGTCLFNNTECGSVTSSSLCEFDMEPTKGTCSDDGSACLFDAACDAAGGVTCSPTGDCLDATGEIVEVDETPVICGTLPAVECGDCEQSDQFRLLFAPDVQNWVAYKLNASNPGQFYYNAIYASDGGDVTLTFKIPYPFVTQGAMPLHVYDADLVGSDGYGCLDPIDALAGAAALISIEDWIGGLDSESGEDSDIDWNLDCEAITGPGGEGFCTLEITIPDQVIPDETEKVYVNLHLDYGLKGKDVDANPYDSEVDRYDRAGYISPWGSSDALENNGTNDGPVAIADCQPYWFEHTDDPTAGICDSAGSEGGAPCVVGAVSPDACVDDGGTCEPLGPLFDDAIENLNIFKRIAGAFGRVFCSDPEGPIAGTVELLKADGTSTDLVSDIDDDGYHALAWRHKGKPAEYKIKWCDVDEIECHTTEPFWLQANGWSEVNLVAGTGCEELNDPTPNDWLPIDPQYGSGKFKNN